MNSKSRVVDPEIPILIAESNYTDLSKLKRNFEKLFFKNLSATGRGYRAVELGVRQKYEAIFVSNALIHLDGLQVIQSIREEGENISTPIIFVSENRGDPLVEKGSILGADRTIYKPITQESLRSLLEDILDTHIITESEEKDRIMDAMKEARLAIEFAKKLRMDGEYELAHEAFRKVLAETLCGLAEVYLSKGDKKGADEIIEEARNIDRVVSKNFEIREESFLEQGKIWLQKRQYIGARAEFQAALTLNEENVTALYGLGEALYGLKELDEAKKVFERVLEAKKSLHDAQMYKDMGMIACQGKHFDLAHKALDRAMKISPSDSKAFYCKAVAFVASGDFGESLPYLDKSLQLDPGFVEARGLEHKVRTWMKEMNQEGQTLSDRKIT